MKDMVFKTLQIAAVFIGTIVGAGLASGREITQFFTQYGYKSFIGIVTCALIYIISFSIIIKLSVKYKLNSYSELISLVCPGFLGKLLDILTTLFLLASSGIILAGSGDMLHQYFHIPKLLGIFLMTLLTLIVLLRDLDGLVGINTIIVPSLIIVLTTVFLLYFTHFSYSMNYSYFINVPYSGEHWLISTLLYVSFNIMCSSGIIIPLSSNSNSIKIMTAGVILGTVGLTLLCLMINTILMLNVPLIYDYPIPLLYASAPFGSAIQIMLLIIIWLEMFSTEVSDVFSVGKTLSQVFKISYNQSLVFILLLAIPISQVGFITLIKVLYPLFGIISGLFILQCFVFYIRNKTVL